jgi:hypothetical protein
MNLYKLLLDFIFGNEEGEYASPDEKGNLC